MSEALRPSSPDLRSGSTSCSRFQRSCSRAAPSGCESAVRPFCDGVTPNGAYIAGRYPEPAMTWLMETKPGRMSDGCRESCDSSDTTAPMCGAIDPVAPPGLRAICTHSCARLWTAAQESPERMMASLSRWSAVFGISPCGQRMAPNVVGAKSAGVHVPSFRSQVSTWLGAPERKMRMQFFADFCSVGLTAVADCSSFALVTSAKYERARPVPATRRKRRRVNPPPKSGKELPSQQRCMSTSSIEQELEFVEEGKLQVLGFFRQVPALQVRDGGGTLRRRRRTRQRRQVERVGDGGGVLRRLQRLRHRRRGVRGAD